MLDAYSSIGMPLFYKHWSFGKHFARNEAMYRAGMQGLAYEIVINSNPCISYIMEENTATMQTLVIAHAAFGHNHFFKNNYVFRQWTDADGILDYLEFARGYIAHCEERYGEATGRAPAGRGACADEATACTAIHAARAADLRSEEKREQERREHDERVFNDLWRTVPGQRAPPRKTRRRKIAAARCCSCRRRTSSISWRRPRRACSPGSAKSCASCASSRSISIRSGRPS